MTDVTIAEMQILSLNQNLKELKRHPRNTISSYTGTRSTEENILIHKWPRKKTFARSSILPFSSLPADKGQITE